jgi:hypothetical protein
MIVSKFTIFFWLESSSAHFADYAEDVDSTEKAS